MSRLVFHIQGDHQMRLEVDAVPGIPVNVSIGRHHGYGDTWDLERTQGFTLNMHERKALAAFLLSIPDDAP